MYQETQSIGIHDVQLFNTLSNASAKTEREIGTGMQRMN